MRKLYITKTHIILEIMSYVLLLVSFILAIVGVVTIKGEFATHYDFEGNATGYGSPAVLFLVPTVILLSNLLISATIHLMKAESWNMPFKVKESREIQIYKDMVLMDVLLELEIAVFTLAFTIMSFTQKMGGAMLLTVLLMVAIMVTIVGYFVVATKHNK